MINYFRHTFFNCIEIIEPTVQLIRRKKITLFVWSYIYQQAFDELQFTILNKPTIKNINFDKPLYLTTDALKTSVCGISTQKYKDSFYLVEFFKQVSESETRYSFIKCELYAIYLDINIFMNIYMKIIFFFS